MKTNLLKRSTTYFTLLLFALLTTFKGIAGGPPGGCSPASNISCAAPTATCSDPTFNAGSGGSINCVTATPINMPGCESSITGTTANSADGLSVNYTGCGSSDVMVWYTFTAPASTNNFTLTPG